MNKELTPLEALASLRQECRATYFDEKGKQWWTTNKEEDYRCNIIETALKKYQELLKIEYRQNTINDFYPNTKKMIDDLLDLLCTKLCDFLKEGKTYIRASVLEDLGFAIRYVKTFAYGGEFNETEKMGIKAKKLKALEIIKEKKVNVRAFLKCCHREDGLLIYNNQCDNKSVMESKELTQEEYDLLKEVLL